MGYNRKLLSEISNKLSQRKDLAKPKDIIKDPEGQWKFPGQPTRIPSSDITMKGVPYPVLGIGSTGQKQMMYPNQEYQFPGSTYVDEYPQDKDAMNAMMKARLAYANEFGNPAAQRMITLPDHLYDFGDGNMGSHYMASMDNYAVPQIQDVNGKLVLGDFGPESNEAIRFDRPEDAQYFAEHYKDVSPAFIETELTPEEIEEYKKGGYIVEELPKAQEGGETWWEKVKREIKEKEENEFLFNLEGLKKGIAHVESADGNLMKNPNSSATGLYGQLFSEKGVSDIYSGTRDEFAKDIDAQNKVFDIRLNKGIAGNSLIKDAKDLKKEYAPQIKDFNKRFSNEDLIILDNFLGRQGTRKYLGNVIRDGKSLAEVFPHLYGKNVAAPNHTPEVYLSKARPYYIKENGGALENYAPGGAKNNCPDGQVWSPIAKKCVTFKAPVISKNDIGLIKKEVPKSKPVGASQVRQPSKPKSTSSIADQHFAAEKRSKDTGIENKTVDEATWNRNRDIQNKEHLSDLINTAGEITGVNSVIRTGERIVTDPLKFGSDIIDNATQLAEVPWEAAMTGANYLFGDANNYVNYDADGQVLLDAITAAPIFSQGIKLGRSAIKPGLNFVDDLVYPTRGYRMESAVDDVSRQSLFTDPVRSAQYDEILDGGKIVTKDLGEAIQYGSGVRGEGSGLLNSQDQILTEVKIPFWNKGVKNNKQFVAFKESEPSTTLFNTGKKGNLNENEYIIPEGFRGLFYPSRSTTIKGVPKNLADEIYQGTGIPFPGSSTRGKDAYKYIEDQVNAVTGHNYPLHNPNVLTEHPIYNYTQPNIAPNPGVGSFKSVMPNQTTTANSTVELIENLKSSGLISETIPTKTLVENPKLLDLATRQGIKRKNTVTRMVYRPEFEAGDDITDAFKMGTTQRKVYTDKNKGGLGDIPRDKQAIYTYKGSINSENPIDPYYGSYAVESRYPFDYEGDAATLFERYKDMPIIKAKDMANMKSSDIYKSGNIIDGVYGNSNHSVIIGDLGQKSLQPVKVVKAKDLTSTYNKTNELKESLDLLETSKSKEFVEEVYKKKFKSADDAKKWLESEYDKATEELIQYKMGEKKPSSFETSYYSPLKHKLKKGGSIELELTDEEIQQYVDGGYIVEELPKAQSGIMMQGPKSFGVLDEYLNEDTKPKVIEQPIIDIKDTPIKTEVEESKYTFKDVKEALKNAGVNYDLDLNKYKPTEETAEELEVSEDDDYMSLIKRQVMNAAANRDGSINTEQGRVEPIANSFAAQFAANNPNAGKEIGNRYMSEKSWLDNFLEGASDIADATGETLLNTVSTTGEALQQLHPLTWAEKFAKSDVAEEYIYKPINQAIWGQDYMPTSKEELLETPIGLDIAENIYKWNTDKDYWVNRAAEYLGNPWSFTAPVADVFRPWGPTKLSEEEQQWLRRKLEKEGRINTPDEIIKAPKESKIKIVEQPKPKQFFEEISTVKDSYDKNNTLLSYRSQWNNDEGFRYLATPVRKDRRSSDEYNDVIGVGHFLLDASASKSKPYSHNYNKAFIDKAIKNNDWIPTFVNEEGDFVRLKYKKPNEILETDKVITPLRQMTFNQIDFSQTQTPKGFKKGINEVMTKDGQGTYLLFKNRDGYSRFSGGSVVFIFKDKYGNTIVRDFAGSLNQIENEGANIQKQYNLKPQDLTIGYHDVGSFSAKIKAKNGKLKGNQWSGFNNEGWTGGALLIPKSQ